MIDRSIDRSKEWDRQRVGHCPLFPRESFSFVARASFRNIKNFFKQQSQRHHQQQLSPSNASVNHQNTSRRRILIHTMLVVWCCVGVSVRLGGSHVRLVKKENPANEERQKLKFFTCQCPNETLVNCSPSSSLVDSSKPVALYANPLAPSCVSYRHGRHSSHVGMKQIVGSFGVLFSY